MAGSQLGGIRALGEGGGGFALGGVNLSHVYEPLQFLGGSAAAGTQQDWAGKTRAGNPHEAPNSQADPIRNLHAEQHSLYTQHQEHGSPTDAGGPFTDSGNVNPYHLWGLWGGIGLVLYVYLRSSAHHEL